MTATVIDLFAGAGGSSEGARQAGLKVLWAANHSPLAVKIHALNHPDTHHECQDLHQCDWTRVPCPDIVLASPACQGHSKAATSTKRRGALPKHTADRSSAWAVVACLEAQRAPLAIIENVPEMRTWELYGPWRWALETLGYTIHEHVFDAADFGVPQHRERLIITASRSKAPLVLASPSLPHVGARGIMVEMKSRWRDIRKLPPDARARIERAALRHRGPLFLAHYVTDDYGHDPDQPMKTITTCNQWLWVRRNSGQLERRMFSSLEYARGQSFDDGYRLTGKVNTDVKLIGNAVPPKMMKLLLQDAVRRA